ncbi:MAG: helix-turn-helix domain-containing protein [Pseudarcicella sp.]|nr:helix-turn-helix domain-containing protein [Pseudarcicella sp.]
MASQLGISQNAYSKIESSQTKIKAESLEQIAEILEIDKNKLLKDDNNTFYFEQINNDNGSGVNIYQENFEKERAIWLKVESDLRSLISAKDEIIQLQAKTIDALFSRK